MERTSRPCSRRNRSSSSFSAIFCFTDFFLRGGKTAAVLGASGSESSSSQSSCQTQQIYDQKELKISIKSIQHAKERGFRTHLDFILNILVVELLASGSGKLRRRSDLLWLVVVFYPNPEQGVTMKSVEYSFWFRIFKEDRGRNLPQSLMLTLSVFRWQCGVSDDGDEEDVLFASKCRRAQSCAC